MKALTVMQPYAHFIAIGQKPIENRTWETRYRGPLAIHAGRSRAWLDPDDETTWPSMVFGAYVAVATLTHCVRLDDLPATLRTHTHAHGPWCWVLADVRRLPTPIAARGRQGLFTPEPAVRSALARELEPAA